MVDEQQLRANKWLINTLHENLSQGVERYIRKLSKDSAKHLTFNEFVELAIGDLETAKENLDELPIHFSLEIERLIEGIKDYYIDENKFRIKEDLVPSVEILTQQYLFNIHEEGVFASLYAEYFSTISEIILTKYTDWAGKNTVKSFS